MNKKNNFFNLGTNIFLFTLFFMLFYLCVLYLGSFFRNAYTPNMVYNKKDSTSIKKLRGINTNTDRLKILFIGSSHASRGYDVRIFNKKGLKSFNLGSSSQTPIQTEYLLKKYLDTLKPEMVIFDVYPIMFTIDGAESGLDIVVNSEIDTDVLSHMIKLNNIKLYNGFVYRFLSDFLKINNYRSPQEGFKYIEGGFEEYKGVGYKKDLFLKDKELIWNKNQLISFYNIISLLKNKNIPFYLFESPVSKHLYSSYKNHKDFDSIMNETNSDYFNFNKLIKLEDSIHFVDKDHLNHIGVNIYNQYILDSIF